MNRYVLISVEPAEGAEAGRNVDAALAAARAQIKALQADNIRMRVELADSERTINMVRKTIKNLQEAL